MTRGVAENPGYEALLKHVDHVPRSTHEIWLRSDGLGYKDRVGTTTRRKRRKWVFNALSNLADAGVIQRASEPRENGRAWYWWRP